MDVRICERRCPQKGECKEYLAHQRVAPRRPNPLFRQTLRPWSSRQPRRLFSPLARGLLRKLDSQHQRVFAFSEKIHFPAVAMNDNPVTEAGP